MAQCALNPHEFVQNAFNPFVAVLCTEKAEAVCQKNNLSFVDMVQPFCKLNTEAHLRDPMNQSFTVRNLRINLSDMQYEAPKTLASRKMLHDVIATTMPNLGDRSRQINLNASGYSLQINNSTPWFEAYRDCFLKTGALSDHEFTGHYLACICVASVGDSEPMQEFAKMNQTQHAHQHQSSNKPSKWFFNNTLRYYVLLQDVIDDETPRTESLYLNLKSTYGANACHLMRINSRDVSSSSINFEENQPTSNLPDPWSQFLTKRLVDPDLNDSDISTPSPIDDNECNKVGSLATSDNGVSGDSVIPAGVVDHPLMPHHYQKSPPSSICAIEISGLEEEEGVDSGPSPSSENVSAANALSPAALPSHLSTSSSSTSLPNPTAGQCSMPHGVCLTLNDMDQIRQFIHDFCTRALLPFVEKQMSILHEAVANRKGLHRSFFSATKKWFGGNKPAPTTGSAATTFVVYSPEAVELQVRRLGDLAFMFQHYDLAYQAYHTVKRDFNSDQAWMHYAGALEMAALSVFMCSSTQRPLPFHYFDNAISTYLNTCKSTQFATRATLLATECLKQHEKYLETANYFIRLTSEDSDLRSGLLLEQAAHCFANLKCTCVRKYAFYLILAGHRFNKAGQKKHSLRCYKQAMQVYETKGWLLAEDHINLIVGRLNFNLNLLDEAASAFHKLLYDGSLQGSAQQTYYVREYLAICHHLFCEKNGESRPLSQLPLPVIETQDCTLILSDMDANQSEEGVMNDSDGPSWCELEEAAIVHAMGSLPVKHQPMLHRYTAHTDNSKPPVAVVDEVITLQLTIRNPLKIAVSMTAVHLLWNFVADGVKEVVNNQTSSETNSSPSAMVETRVLPELVLDDTQTVRMSLGVVPHRTGRLQLNGVAYNLAIQTVPQAAVASNGQAPLGNGGIGGASDTGSYFTVRGMQPLSVVGPRLNSTKAEKCSTTYGNDYRLEQAIVSPLPLLSVLFHGFPNSLLCGQICSFVLEVHNLGQVGIRRLSVLTATPTMVSFGNPSDTPIEPDLEVYEGNVGVHNVPSDDPRVVFSSWSPNGADILRSGQRLWLPVCIRAPEMAGSHFLDLLFYYEASEGAFTQQNPRYRVFRRRETFLAHEIVVASATALAGTQPASNSRLPNVTLTMKISNTSHFIEEHSLQLRLAQISCISKRWTIEKINCVASREVQIGPKETLHLCVQAVENRVQSEVDQEQLSFSNIVFQDNEIDSSIYPCFDFCQKATQASASNETSTEKDGQELDLTLAILWKAFSSTQNVAYHGQHHLVLNDIDVPVSTKTEKKKVPDEKPSVRIFASWDPRFPNPSQTDQPQLPRRLRYLLCATPEVNHDFSSSRTCIVPVFLVLYNCAEFDVDVLVDANRTTVERLSPRSPMGLTVPLNGAIPTAVPAAPILDEGNRFAWVGASRIRVPLKLKETKTVRLNACFFQHGTYSLGGVHISGNATLEVHQHHSILVTGSAQVVIVRDSLKQREV